MKWQIYESLERRWKTVEQRGFFRWVLYLLVIDIVLMVVGYGPARWWRVRLEARDIAGRQTVRTMQRAYQEWMEVLYRIEAAQRVRERLLNQTLLPEDQGFPRVRQALETWIRQNGLQRRSIGYTWKRISAPPLRGLTIRLTLQGTYPQVRTLIERIESSDLFLIIDSVQLRAMPEGQVIADLQLRTYFRFHRSL